MITTGTAGKAGWRVLAVLAVIANMATLGLPATAAQAAGSSTAHVLEVATVPGPPTALRTISGDTRLTLDFQVPGDDGGAPITGYQYSLDGGAWVALNYGDDRPPVISNLVNGQTYAVRIRAVNSAGPGAATDPVAGTPNATVPFAPRDLRTGAPGNRSQAITFTAPYAGGSPILKYQVNTDGTWRDLVTTVSGTTVSATVDGLEPMTPTTVTVRAVNAVGAGPGSDPVSVAVQGSPDAPAGLRITPGDTRLTLAFSHPQNDGGAAITGYQYSLDGGAWVALDFGDDRPPVISNLTNGQTYAVRVRAVNSYGGGPASDPVNGTPVAVVPFAPRNLTYAKGNAAVTLTFTAPYDGGSPIVKYQASIGGTWQDFATVTSGASVSGTISGLPAGTSQGLSVRAVNAVGGGASSAPMLVAVEGAPNAPAGLQVTPGNAQLALSFTEGSYTGGGASSFQYSLDGGAWTALAAPYANGVNSGIVTGLTNGRAYAVRVRATNIWGDGAASTPVNGTPVSDVPATPSGLTVTAGDASATVSFSIPAGGAAISSYEVSTDGGTTWTALTVTGTGPYTGTLTGLANGTTYQVQARARGTAGAGPATASVAVTPVSFADSDGPGAPTGVVVTAGTSALTVTWAAVDDPSVTGYTATANPGPGSCTTTGETTCTIGATGGTSYTVTVVATTATGSSAPSDLSAPVTPDSPTAPATAPPAGGTPLDSTQGSTVTPGQGCYFAGEQYAPRSEVVMYAYSDPEEIGRTVTDENGAFSLEVTLPDDLEPGAHTIAAVGVDPDGNQRIQTLAVTAVADDAVAAPSPTPSPSASTPTPPVDFVGGGFLPRTGGGVLPLGVLLVALGGVLVPLGRRPRRVS